MIFTRTVLWSVVLIVLTIHIEHTLSCLCKLIKFKCPAPPTCCESGHYALDECGCCLKCAKAELQTCGGANDISGRCSSGLQCLKTCLPCKTVGDRGKPCVFPFEYSGRTYDKCTSRDSDNGQPWCATEVDATGYVVDNAWGDCLDGCPGTRVECDDKYFSIQEGKCIDVSVPGAIPNWFGAPAVKLLDPTTGLSTAPVCRSKGAAVRLYDNTCRCVRGETAVDLDTRGTPRGNCTGLEDDSTDNLDKVWCFLENIRNPLEPKSGCYSDTRWSERDARFWSSLACFQAPDIEGGNNPAIHPGNVNRKKNSSPRKSQRKPQNTRRTTRRTTTKRKTTRQTITTTTTAVPLEQSHTFDFSSDYEYSDFDEYYEEENQDVAFGPQRPPITNEPEVVVDSGFAFILGETNLPGFVEIFNENDREVINNPQGSTLVKNIEKEKNSPMIEDQTDIELSVEKSNGVEQNVAYEEGTTDYAQDTVDFEDATETVEINIFDDLDELINEINQKSQNITDNLKQQKNDKEKLDKKENISSVIQSSVEDKLDELFKDVIDQNIRDPVIENTSSNPTITTIKPARQRKQRPKKITQHIQKKQSKPSPQPEMFPVTLSLEEEKNTNDVKNIEVASAAPENVTVEGGLTTKKPKRIPKQRKRPQKNKENKQTKEPLVVITDSPTLEILIVGPQSLEDAGYELYTEQEPNSAKTTTAPDIFFGININL